MLGGPLNGGTGWPWSLTRAAGSCPLVMGQGWVTEVRTGISTQLFYLPEEVGGENKN